MKIEEAMVWLLSTQGCGMSAAPIFTAEIQLLKHGAAKQLLRLAAIFA